MGATTSNTSDHGKGNHFVHNLDTHEDYEGYTFASLHVTTCAFTTKSHSLLHLFSKQHGSNEVCDIEHFCM